MGDTVSRLEVGRIVKPHGLRGEVIVELTTNRTERLDPGTRLHAGARQFEVLASSPHQHRWIVSFAGVTDRGGAEELRGTVLTAEPLDDPAEMWVHELIGSRLVDSAGVDHGAVVSVQANPASDLLVLEDGGLVPLRFVIERRPGTVVAELPPGLLD